MQAYEAGQAKLSAGAAQIAAAEQQLQDAQAQLAAGQQALDAAAAEIAAGQSKLDTAAGYELGYTNGVLAFSLYSPGLRTLRWPLVIRTNAWFHLAATYDGHVQRLYTNGALATETNCSAGGGGGGGMPPPSGDAMVPSTLAPRIGASALGSPTNFFGGLMDDLRLYADALDSTTVHALWEMGSDTDQDGLSAWMEAQLNSNPRASDTDQDGMPDHWEIQQGFNLLVADASGDPDSDGLNNGDEYSHGTDPNWFDTDMDGFNDGEEIHTRGTNPLSQDSDGDGLKDKDELTIYLTQPADADSDNDNLPDGWEVANKLNPLNASGLYGQSGDPDQDSLSTIFPTCAPACIRACAAAASASGKLWSIAGFQPPSDRRGQSVR